MSGTGLTDYFIDIYNLSNKVHEYDFEIGEAFFEEFENSPAEKGHLTCLVALDKTERMITAEFRIKGEVELVCDRSLELFGFPIDIIHKVFFKYSDMEEELDENVYSIPTNKQRLEIGHLIFEFIALAIPMKRIHPDHMTGEDMEGLVYLSSEDVDEKETDPRWEILKNLKK